MKKIVIILCSILFLCGLYFPVHAQEVPYNQAYRAITNTGDTILMVNLRPVYCFPPYKFKNAKEEQYYWRTVRDVKRTLPYAKMVYNALIETYEYIQTIPEKQRNDHLKRMEKELFKEYKPVLKSFTYSQGKLLIKLIDRECNQSSFNLIKAFLGGFRAGIWQAFGSMFGVSLKAEWDPQGKDKMLERICVLVENGQL